MGVKVTSASIERTLTLLGKANGEIENAVAEAYAEVGEYVVDGIRSGKMSSWQDRTYSLRSSVGCMVARKGRIIYEAGFEAILGGATGAEKGRELARKLISEYADKDYCLVIVAGEDYAAYVEAIEGKTVLAQGQLYTQRNIPSMLEKKVRQIIRRYNHEK